VTYRLPQEQQRVQDLGENQDEPRGSHFLELPGEISPPACHTASLPEDYGMESIFGTAGNILRAYVEMLHLHRAARSRKSDSPPRRPRVRIRRAFRVCVKIITSVHGGGQSNLSADTGRLFKYKFALLITALLRAEETEIA